METEAEEAEAEADEAEAEEDCCSVLAEAGGVGDAPSPWSSPTSRFPGRSWEACSSGTSTTLLAWTLGGWESSSWRTFCL